MIASSLIFHSADCKFSTFVTPLSAEATVTSALLEGGREGGDTHTNAQRERERDRDRDRQTDRERDRERERELKLENFILQGL